MSWAKETPEEMLKRYTEHPERVTYGVTEDGETYMDIPNNFGVAMRMMTSLKHRDITKGKK